MKQFLLNPCCGLFLAALALSPLSVSAQALANNNDPAVQLLEDDRRQSHYWSLPSPYNWHFDELFPSAPFAPWTDERFWVWDGPNGSFPGMRTWTYHRSEIDPDGGHFYGIGTARGGGSEHTVIATTHYEFTFRAPCDMRLNYTGAYQLDQAGSLFAFSIRQSYPNPSVEVVRDSSDPASGDSVAELFDGYVQLKAGKTYDFFMLVSSSDKGYQYGSVTWGSVSWWLSHMDCRVDDHPDDPVDDTRN